MHQKTAESLFFFSNQTCIIKNDKYLKLPKTKNMINMGKIGCKLINADVNGAYNIARKVYPKAFDAEGVAGFVSTPVAVAIRYPRKSA